MKKIILSLALLCLFFLYSCTEVKQAPPSYSTEEVCESTENCQCDFVMCDLIPEGKTFEEVCGKGFKKGWQCVG